MGSKIRQPILTIFLMSISFLSKAQTNANLIIDSVNVVFKSDVSFPYWLKAGQSLNVGANIASISVLEFTIDTANGNNLKFSQTLSIKSLSRVPTLKTWKIEGVAYLDNSMVSPIPNILTFTSPMTYSTPGSYTWKVPIGVSRVCVEIWGGGGAGANGDSYVGGGGGGGGGGYGYDCFTFSPGSTHTIVVGGSGSNSTFDGSLLFASSGSSGSGVNGGSGGTSNAKIFTLTGSGGTQGNPIPYQGWFGGSMGGGTGGSGANGASGGSGGTGYNNGVPGAVTGNSPGGGGGGGGAYVASYRGNYGGASGGAGKVIIYW